MNIGIFSAIILVAFILWLPLIGVFVLLSVAIARTVPIKGTSKEKLSKSAFWIGVAFIPVEIYLMNSFYSSSKEPGPPFWFFVMFGIAGFLVFYIWSNKILKKKNNS